MARLTRLSWAGARIEAGGTTVLIDPLIDTEPLMRLGLAAHRGAMVPPAAPGSVDAIAVTHVHPDHCDPSGWQAALKPAGQILCPGAVARQLGDKQPACHSMTAWQSVTVGSVTITALPAVDGLGEEQISWLISSDGWSVFHGGDTLWHGYWWRIARKCGSPTIAMLPVNGAVTAFPGMKPSPLPAAMTPEQAVAGAYLLGVGRMVPIHYGEFHAPPVYVETPEVLPRLHSAAAEYRVTLEIMAPGSAFELSP